MPVPVPRAFTLYNNLSHETFIKGPLKFFFPLIFEDNCTQTGRDMDEVKHYEGTVDAGSSAGRLAELGPDLMLLFSPEEILHVLGRGRN